MGLIESIHSYFRDLASDIEFIREEHPIARNREYFQNHTLNDGFELSANNLDHYLQAQHASSGVQGLAGSTLSAGQLLWGIPVGLKDMLLLAHEASQKSASVRGRNVDLIPFGRTSYVLASVGSFMIHGVMQGVQMVGGSVVSWGEGSLNEQNSFQIARQVTLTAGVAGMLLKGGEDTIRGGGNFLNAAKTSFQNLGDMSFTPTTATAALSSIVAVIPASGLPELGASVCMMSANRPAASNTSLSTPGRTREVVASAPDDEIPVVHELPEEPPVRDLPDRELVAVPRRDFIQGSQIPEVSFGDEAPLRRVSLSPLRILKAAATNSLWESYVQTFGGRPWAIIGRISEENENVSERGRWGVVRRGASQAELREWLADATNMETASQFEKSLGRRQVDDGWRLFETDTLQIHEVIPEDALEHPEGFNSPDQPVVDVIDWPRAVAAADGMGRLLTKGRNLFNDLPANQAERNVVLLQQSMGREAHRFSEDTALDLESASPGYLLTEAEWEGAARGPLEPITVSPSDFPAFVRGPQINGRYFQGTIPRRENFVQIVNPQTMEFGREVFTNPNHPMVQDWLKNGVLGAWRVFAGDLEQGIWSSVFEQRSATRSVLEEPENTFGLRGMNGNVWQWINDWFGSYEAPANPGEAIQNPRGPASGNTRVLRGGSWLNYGPGALRAAFRNDNTPDNRLNSIGFRFGVLPQD